ncbi:hypothetical protein M9458_036912, partial [Cirrhinus mrigala]
LAAYIEWVLVSCRSSSTVDIADDDTCPTHDPVRSQPSPRSAESQSQRMRQVRDPATELTTGENDERSSTHGNITEGELSLQLGQMDLIDFFTDIYADMPPLIPPSSELSVDPEPSVCPDLSACLDFPRTFPLLPHPCHLCLLTAPLLTLSPPSVPVSFSDVAGVSLVSTFSLRVLDSASALRSSGSWLPRLHRHLSGHQLHRAPSFLRLRLDWLSTRHRLRTPTPQSSVAPAPPWSPEPCTPPWLSGSSVSPGLVGSPSAPRAPHPLAAPPLVKPFLHHGSSLRQLRCGPPSWLRPRSRLASPAPGPFCLHPGSSLHCHH